MRRVNVCVDVLAGNVTENYTRVPLTGSMRLSCRRDGREKEPAPPPLTVGVATGAAEGAAPGSAIRPQPGATPAAVPGPQPRPRPRPRPEMRSRPVCGVKSRSWWHTGARVKVDDAPAPRKEDDVLLAVERGNSAVRGGRLAKRWRR